MPSKLLFQNGFILRKPGVVNFADIINIAIMFIKKPLETQTNLKEIEIMY